MRGLFDVVVVGGGPAGATTARLLSNSGLKVLLLEKKSEFRYKPCAGGLSAKVLPYLPDGYGEVVERKISRVVVHFDTESTEFEYEKPLIYTVKRERFDRFLRESARESGAEIHYNEAFVSSTQKNSTILLSTTKEEYRTKYLIGADGYPSLVGRVNGIKTNHRTKILTLECEVPLNDDRWIDGVHLFLFDGIIGYGWIFPKKDLLSVGVGATLLSGREKLYDYLKKLFSIADLEYTKASGYLYSVGPNRRSMVNRGNVFLVGDAIGVADPFSGEGIYYAMKSAHVLSSYILSPFGSIENRLKNEIYNKQKRGQVLSFVFYRFFKHILKMPTFAESGKVALRMFMEDGDFYYSVHFPWRRVLGAFLRGTKR